MGRLMLLLVVLVSLPARAIDLSEYTIVDLTHELSEDSLFWPTSPSRFKLTRLAQGDTPGGWFYTANSFCMPEHGGTHLDAPIHFFRDRATTDQIPLDHLVGPVVVIDVSAKAEKDPDYRVSVADIQDFEQQHGPIPAGARVLMRSDWSTRWPDAKTYLGDDTPGRASDLHFPGFGPDATRYLVEERSIRLMGVDTASIDPGASKSFQTHRIAAEANVAGLENLTNLAKLPATGAVLFALPVKIAGGSGGPVRVIALVPKPAK